MAFTAGGVAGLVLVHRLLDHIDPKRLLAISGVGCAICYGAWLALPSSVPSSILFALAGTFSAAHYPIATARAYAALPGRATLVAAATQPLGVIDLVLPLTLGWLVDTLGLGWALLVLLLQPLGLVFVALVARR